MGLMGGWDYFAKEGARRTPPGDQTPTPTGLNRKTRTTPKPAQATDLVSPVEGQLLVVEVWSELADDLHSSTSSKTCTNVESREMSATYPSLY